eukprot:maker-scaffold155_size301336-snap-gene-2.10 protein:Tk03785 transcript:maker-scaffold155_size301336-snap-gene-2.10-mRNA-1 annotation:"GJ24375"
MHPISELQFAFKQQINTETYGVPYDHKSIMHYTWRAFAKDRSKPTIVSKHHSIPTKKLGSSHEPTNLDIKKIKRMYGCDVHEDKDYSDFDTSAYGGGT